MYVRVLEGAPWELPLGDLRPNLSVCILHGMECDALPLTGIRRGLLADLLTPKATGIAIMRIADDSADNHLV